MKNTKEKTEMTEGPVFWKIFRYAIPLVLTGIFQTAYNAADTIVVGKFSADSSSLAAVGSTSHLTNLIINLLLGLSVGTSVLIAQYYGAKQYDDVSKTVHTSLVVSFIGGVLIGAFGIVFARPLLSLMGSPSDVIGKASLYMIIIFAGLPASAVFNFGAAILRAKGDTKRPLIILTYTGIIDLTLNFVFVIFCKLDVAGVALSTIIAQYLCAITILIMLYRTNEHHRFRFKSLRIDTKILKKMAAIGLPAGVQGCIFSVSNVIIQSSINTFPTDAIAGNTVAMTLEGLAYTAMNAFYHACLAFTGQNFGAKKYGRIKKVLAYSLIQVAAVGIIICMSLLLSGRFLCSLFTNTEEVKSTAMLRLQCILSTYFLCGMMEVLAGRLRGVGYSITPMLSSALGVCVFRIGWVLFIFPLERFNNPVGLYISFPISWIIVVALHAVTIFATRKSMYKKKLVDENELKEVPA